MADTQTPAAAGSGGTRSPITDEQVRSSLGVETVRGTRSRRRRSRRSRRSRNEPSAEVVSVSAPSSSGSIVSRLADFVMTLLRDLDEAVSSLLS